MTGLKVAVMPSVLYERDFACDLTVFWAEKKKLGLSDDEIIVLANAKFGGQDPVPGQNKD